MKKIMILSVLIMIPNWAVAGNSNIPHTHTNTPIELEFVSTDSSGIRVAAVCFLGMGDCGAGGYGKGDDDMSIDSAQRCINDGYDKTSCPLPAYLSDACPYNEGYFAQCVEDKKRACKEAGFGDVACGVGEVADVACPYDSSYKKCKCNPCEGFTYSYVEATVQGYVSDGSCQSCEVVKYKRKENPCSDYQTCECGGEIGSSVCYSGNMKKFNSCKPCCDPNCPAGTTESYPGGCGGSTQNGCKNKTCYYGYQSCFRPYLSDCCDDINGCAGPGFCNTPTFKYCSLEYEICRERGGVPSFISCYTAGYTNYDNHGANVFFSCALY